MATFIVNKEEMDFLTYSHRNPDFLDMYREGENNRMRKFSFTVAEILEVIGIKPDPKEEINFYVGKLNEKGDFNGKNSKDAFATKFNITDTDEIKKLKYKQVLIMTKATDKKEVAPNASIDELFGANAKPKVFPTGSTGIVSKICPPPLGCA